MRGVWAVVAFSLILLSTGCSNDPGRQVQAMLENVHGVSVKAKGDVVVLDGEVDSFADYRRVMKVAEHTRFRDKVVNLTIPSKGWLSRASSEIYDELQLFAPHVTVEVSGQTLILGGAVPSVVVAERAILVAELYLPEHWSDDSRRTIADFMVVVPEQGTGPIIDEKRARNQETAGRAIAAAATSGSIRSANPDCSGMEASLRQVCETMLAR